MRILYLAPPARQAGTKLGRYSFLHEEICGLAEQGLAMYVVAPAPIPLSPPGVLVQRSGGPPSTSELRRMLTLLAAEIRHVPTLSLIEPKKLLQAVRIECLAARIIRSEGIDAIHSHFGWPKGFGGLLASRSTGVPLIASFHGADILVDKSIHYGRRRDPFFARAIRLLLARADRTIFYSDYMRKEGVRLGARQQATRVIYWGTDVAQFTCGADSNELRTDLGLGASPLVLVVAGLIERKGVDIVLRALALLKDRHPFTLVVCGDGPELSNLKELASQLRVDKQVRFAGRIDRAVMPKYFAAADVFAHGALTEAAGIVLIEAMASCCPVVCTDAGGPAEYIQDGITGFVVPVKDPEAMASRVAWLLDHPAQARQFGEAARARSVKLFGRQRMLDEVIGVYSDVIKDPGRSGDVEKRRNDF